MELRDYVRAAVGVERVAAWFVAALTVVVVFSVATAGVPTAGPPSATFDVSYDGATQSYTITHAGGETIGAGASEALVVTVTGSQQTSNVTWAGEDGVTAFSIQEGDAITIDDPRVDSDDDTNYFDGDATVGFELVGEEAIEIRWTGRPLGAPDTKTAVLDSTTPVNQSG